MKCIGQHTIDCDSGGCSSQELNCTHDGDCLIKCGADYGCQNATINCPINGKCKVNCTGDYACEGANINAADGQQLNMSCVSASSCKSSSIVGGHDSELNILCGKSFACNRASFDGLLSSWLRLFDCATDLSTCTGVTVWCPQNVNGEKHCMIKGILFANTLFSGKH